MTEIHAGAGAETKRALQTSCSCFHLKAIFAERLAEKTGRTLFFSQLAGLRRFWITRHCVRRPQFRTLSDSLSFH